MQLDERHDIIDENYLEAADSERDPEQGNVTGWRRVFESAVKSVCGTLGKSCGTLGKSLKWLGRRIAKFFGRAYNDSYADGNPNNRNGNSNTDGDPNNRTNLIDGPKYNEIRRRRISTD